MRSPSFILCGLLLRKLLINSDGEFQLMRQTTRFYEISEEIGKLNLLHRKARDSKRDGLSTADKDEKKHDEALVKVRACIKNYDGTPEQKDQLLNMIQCYKAIPNLDDNE